MWRSLQRCGSTPWNAYCALNHLDGQRELVSKKGLFRNLLRYCVAEEGEGDLRPERAGAVVAARCGTVNQRRDVSHYFSWVEFGS